MKRFISGIKGKFGVLHRDQRGLEAMEYLLVAALVIIAAIGAYRFLGETISAEVKNVATTTSNAVRKGIEGAGDLGSTSESANSAGKPE